MTKEHLAEAAKALSKNFSIDQFIERLILIESFEEGREQYEQGETLTHEEVGKRLEKWLR